MKRLTALVLLFALASAQVVEYSSNTPSSLLGILKYLARQAGYELDVPINKTFLSNVVPEPVSGNFEPVVEQLLATYAPDYVLKGTPPRFEISQKVSSPARPMAAPAAASPQRTSSAAPAAPSPMKENYFIIQADGQVLRTEAPLLHVAMVIDETAVVQNGEVKITLTPLGPACLYKGTERVCLRALTPGIKGEVKVSLGGQEYRVKYETATDALVLYRYQLGSTPPASAGGVVVKPNTALPHSSITQPVSRGELPVGQIFRGGQKVVWNGLSLAPVTGSTRWLSAGSFRQAENAVRLYKELKPLRPGLVRLEGIYRVLVEDTPANRKALTQRNIRWVAHR